MDNDVPALQMASAAALTIDGATRVSALLHAPPNARACCVLAHGAGAGMTHPSWRRSRPGFPSAASRRCAISFPTWKRQEAAGSAGAGAGDRARRGGRGGTRELPALPLVAGGKSFGGRMTSQAQAAAALPGVRGLVFLGFPLHPAGKPSRERARHLADVDVPMLFLQGTRDELARRDELEPVIAALGARAALRLFDDADHSFHVPRRTGRSDAQVLGEMLDALGAWVDQVIAG